MASIGHALVHDFNYGEKSDPTANFFLHAQSLEFWDPDSQSERRKVEAELPDTFHKFVDSRLEVVDTLTN